LIFYPKESNKGHLGTDALDEVEAFEKPAMFLHFFADVIAFVLISMAP